MHHTSISDEKGFVYSVGLNENGELGTEDNEPREIYTKIGKIIIEAIPEITKVPKDTSKDIVIELVYSFNLKRDIAEGEISNISSTNTKEATIEKIDGIDNSNVINLENAMPNYRITGGKIGRTAIIAESADTKTRTLWINIVNNENAKASAKVVNGSGYTIALRSNGTVWGFGNITNTNEPKQIETEEKIIDITSGISHILMVGKSGAVYALGENGNGQLGTGNVITYSTPVKLNLKDIQKVMAVENTSYAIDKEGNVWSFGEAYAKVPTINEDLQGAIEVGRNYYLMPDGIVRYIKDNSIVQLSLNEYDPAGAPDIIEEKIMQMSEGTDHLLMLGESGRVYSYGKNTYGQLGDNRNRIKRKWNKYNC